MKKSYRLFFIILISIILKSQVINISKNNSDSINPFFTTKENTKYVLWNDNENENYDVFFKYCENGNWSNVKKIITQSNTQLSSMCQDDSSNIFILWIETENTQNRLICGQIRDSVFVDSIEICSYQDSIIIFSSILYDNIIEAIHVTFDIQFKDTVHTFYTLKESKEKWIKPLQLLKRSDFYNKPRSQLIKDKNNNLLCFYNNADSHSVECLKKVSENQWINWTSITSEFPGLGLDFIVKTDDSLNVHLVSHQGELLTCPCNWLLYSKWDGEIWSEVENVPSDKNHREYTEHDYPDISFSLENYPVITWEQKNYTGLALYDKYIGTAIKMDIGWNVNCSFEERRKPEKPKISVDSNNLINYVWQDTSDGDYDIYFSKTTLIVSIKDDQSSNISTKFRVNQNYPNPFNPSTTIFFQINDPILKNVDIKIYNSLGQQVRIISENINGNGYYFTTWDGKSDDGYILPTGNYIYCIDCGNTIMTGKMTLIK